MKAQWLTMLAAAVVAIAMVGGAELARESADRHRRVEALVEHLSAQTQAMSALRWRATAEHDADPAATARSTYARGMDIFRDILATTRTLRSAERSPETAGLRREVDDMYAAAMRAFMAMKLRGGDAGHRLEVTELRPAITRLARSLDRASAHQSDVANRSAARSRDGLIGSLIIGLLLIVLLWVRFERLRRRAQQTAIERRSEDRLRALVEHSSDVFVVLGEDFRVRWHAASLSQLTGGTQPLVGEPLTALAHPDDRPALATLLGSAHGADESVVADVRIGDGAGGWLNVEAVVRDHLGDPAIGGLVVNMRDVTVRRGLEDQLRHRAFHDGLTGLANRALLENRLAHANAVARRRKRHLAVLFLDLDDFKTINDSLGHAAGDELLRRVAERVAGALRAGDTASRRGGDEFAVLLEDLEDPAEAQAVAWRIMEALSEPVQISGRELTVGASIGIAVSDGGTGVEELLRNADVAMYAAKDDGKAAVRVFEPHMVRRFVDRLELRAELGGAIEDGQLELDFQPIVELESGRIVSAEALVRWRHPQRGRLGPDQFIGLAEETGLIVALGEWVLRAACRQARALHDAFPDREPIAISVNVSTRQLRDPDFPATVATVLEETGVAPEALVLELTESLLVDNREAVMTQLKALKRLGVRLAVDDFGTGYSVLSYLQEFPIDVLKIDKSFVDDIHTRPDKAKLVAGIVNLGASLALDVVAEGIEEAAQADELRAMQSPFGQGYLFSRPVTGAAVQELLAAEPPAAVGSRH
jgi:diguanylate cyclase (GGDEF)-like protein/PAS domain S-box-containing protein